MFSYNLWPIYPRYPQYKDQGGPQTQSGPGDKNSVDYKPDGQPMNRGFIPVRDKRFISFPQRPARIFGSSRLLYNDNWVPLHAR
jgi:hypothetical protein